MKEAYCSYEISKLLKEKGFDEPCRSYFIDNVDYIDSSYSAEELTDLHMGVWETLRPTHQMACAWLREKGIFFCIHPDYPVSKNYIVEFYDNGVPSGLFGAYEKYEDAVEAAIKYVLENLI